MSSLNERNRPQKSGGNPGLTQVDDIQSGSRIAEDIEPDSTTDRTLALENVKIPKNKSGNTSNNRGNSNGRSASKTNRKHS
jgi:hypothetical protein